MEVRVRSRKVNVPRGRCRGVFRQFCEKDSERIVRGDNAKVKLFLSERVVRGRKKAVAMASNGGGGKDAFIVRLPCINWVLDRRGSCGSMELLLTF